MKMSNPTFTVTNTPRFPGIPSGGKSVTFSNRSFQILFDGEVVEWVNDEPIPCAHLNTPKEALAFLREYADLCEYMSA